MALDLSSIASTLLDKDALSGIASSTGLSSKDVTSVLKSALPSLLDGASKQTSNKSTLEGFASALEKHASKNTSSLTSFFKDIDIDDGSKIVSHLLGDNKGKTADSLAKDLGIDAKDVAKVLACAAPLLMSLLGKKAQSAKKDSDSLSSIASSLLGNADVGSLLKGFLK